MIALFFKTFNEALAEVVGEKGYKFNPSMICVDEAGANLQGLQKFMVMNSWSVLLLASSISSNVRGGS